MGASDEYYTTHVDVSDYLQVKEQARQCHRNQLAPDNLFTLIPAEARRQSLCTLIALPARARPEEWECPADDLFEGLR